MKKLGIIIDSFSGVTKAEADKLDYGYLSLQVILDNKMYKEGIDFKDFESAMKKVENATDKKTSQPNPGDIEDLFKDISKKYEKVIYLCIGSKMSSTNSTASAIASEYNGQIEIFDNSFSGPAFAKAAKWLVQQVNEEGMSLNDAKKHLSVWDKQIQTWIVPEKIDAIRKGGRVVKGAKFLFSKLSIIPMINYVNSSIEVKGVRRGFDKAVATVVSRIIDSIGGEQNIANYEFSILHTTKQSTLDIAKKKLSDAGIDKPNIVIGCVANGIQCGIGAISIAAMPKKIKA